MPVTLHSGHGGKVSVGSSPADLSVIDWQFTKTSRLAETTHSGTGGWATFKGSGMVKEAAGTVNCFWDSEQIPDTDVTLDAGDEVQLRLYCGDSTKFYSFTAVVETLTVTDNNQNDVVKYSFTFKSTGAITDPVT